jgi:hypothetical protein
MVSIEASSPRAAGTAVDADGAAAGLPDRLCMVVAPVDDEQPATNTAARVATAEIVVVVFIGFVLCPVG